MQIGSTKFQLTVAVSGRTTITKSKQHSSNSYHACESHAVFAWLISLTKFVFPKYFVHQRSHPMHILIPNLHKDRATLASAESRATVNRSRRYVRYE